MVRKFIELTTGGMFPVVQIKKKIFLLKTKVEKIKSRKEINLKKCVSGKCFIKNRVDGKLFSNYP